MQPTACTQLPAKGGDGESATYLELKHQVLLAFSRGVRVLKILKPLGPAEGAGHVEAINLSGRRNCRPGDRTRRLQ